MDNALQGMQRGTKNCAGIFPAKGGTLAGALLEDMARDEFRHLEHAHLFLAIEDGLEGVVGIDQGLFLFVLKFVFLDVIPELLGEFAAWERFRSDDDCELLVRLDGLHECGVWFTGGFFGFGSHTRAVICATPDRDKCKIAEFTR